MTPPTLCIIQARYTSTRLPGKMLCELGGETLLARAYRLACEAFHVEHVVVAVPAGDLDGPLGNELKRIGAGWATFVWDGDERDVLGRFYHCATRVRWHPQAVIHRWTPDDPFKEPMLCRRVAMGERLPVELGGEAFTLAALVRAEHTTNAEDWGAREHLSNNVALFQTAPRPCPPGEGWTVDTEADLEAARERLQYR